MGKRRASVGAAALVRKTGPAGQEWLAQWNRGWGAFHLVGGHKHEGETFRECCRREVMEELGLAEGEFRLAEAPAAHLEYEAFSRSAGEVTDYTIELFDVELLPGAAEKVLANPENRWLRQDEVLARACADGRPVSETTERLLRLAGLLG